MRRRALILARELKRRRDRNRLSSYRPYTRQREFHDAGAMHRERLFMAGNQLGKTVAGSFELAMHLTGRYPSWWRGRRFAEAGRYWAAGETRLSTRDTVQKLLVGEPERSATWGCGAIPGDALLGVHRASSGANILDAVSVAHLSGGASTLLFKTYEQGRAKWQGDTLNAVWFDASLSWLSVGHRGQSGQSRVRGQVQPGPGAGLSLARGGAAAATPRRWRGWRGSAIRGGSMMDYLRCRLRERGTWIAIGAAVTGAAALSSPYSWMAIAAGVVAALLPTPGGKGAA